MHKPQTTRPQPSSDVQSARQRRARKGGAAKCSTSKEMLKFSKKILVAFKCHSESYKQCHYSHQYISIICFISVFVIFAFFVVMQFLVKSNVLLLLKYCIANQQHLYFCALLAPLFTLMYGLCTIFLLQYIHMCVCMSELVCKGSLIRFGFKKRNPQLPKEIIFFGVKITITTVFVFILKHINLQICMFFLKNFDLAVVSAKNLSYMQLNLFV